METTRIFSALKSATFLSRMGIRSIFTCMGQTGTATRRWRFSLLLLLLTFAPGINLNGQGWNLVHNWLYQLQGYDLDQIRASAFHLVVMDYSSDGSEAGEWPPAIISSLKASPGGEKKVVAYMSIGEAEDYRFYWQDGWGVGNPYWIVEENPDWPGNYRVMYWESGWQDIIFGWPESYLDRIIAQGFDGVYLDIVDAYTYPYAQGHEQDMVDFVISIAEYAREQSPLGSEFAVFPQNAEDLVETHPEYLAAVNGIGKEETYYLATDIPTPAGDRYWTEQNLDLYKEAGPWGFGLILEIDYCNRPENIDTVYARCEEKGYIPYCSRVELDQTRINPGHEPLPMRYVKGDAVPDSAIIPAGGTLGFQGSITNQTDSAQAIEIWTNVLLPNSSPYPLNPVLGPASVTIGPNQTVERHFTHPIPGYAPPATYFYQLNTGFYPDYLVDQTGFEFEVVGESR